MSNHDPAMRGATGYAVAYLRYRARLHETPPASASFGITEPEGARQRREVEEAIDAIKMEAVEEFPV